MQVHVRDSLNCPMFSAEMRDDWFVLMANRKLVTEWPVTNGNNEIIGYQHVVDFEKFVEFMREAY